MARAERSGAGAFRLAPGGHGGEARRSVGSSALPSRWGLEYRLVAQQSAGVVQRQRGISHCTDRSASGCADRCTGLTTRARACGGLDAAEASPRRCVRWRSRGRRWRGLSARATARPCRPQEAGIARLPLTRPARQRSLARVPCYTWQGRCALWYAYTSHGGERCIETAVADVVHDTSRVGYPSRPLHACDRDAPRAGERRRHEEAETPSRRLGGSPTAVSPERSPYPDGT